MADIPMVHLWMGRRITELSREELIGVIEHLAKDVESTRAQFRSYMDFTAKVRTYRSAFNGGNRGE